MSEFLLVTDLDNTLIGDDDALRCLNDWLKAHRQIYGSKLVYATGRSLKSYQRLATQSWLLEPDVLITASGAEIYYPGNQLDPICSSRFIDGPNLDPTCKANKGNALTHVRQALGFTAKQTVVCGDSGNDITLFSTNTLGIIVGNAHKELRQWHQAHPEGKRYFAQAHYAAGILEGLKYFSIVDDE